MMNPTMRRILVMGVLAITMLATGCAKKAAQTPPTPPQPPPTRETPPTPPSTDTTTPVPTPGTKILGSGDFAPVYFDYDAYSLREDSRGVLDANAKLLRDNAGTKITIEGHCDERGTSEYNQALGERRAQAARDYLVNAGIDTGRLQIVSYGKERPFNAGHDEAAWAENRRAHFVVR